LSLEDAIENGLKVRLNGLDYSSGAAYYVWRKNGQGCGTNPIEVKTYTGPAQFNLQLTVYDAFGLNSDSVTKTINVNEGMQLVFDGVLNRFPNHNALNDNDFWYYYLDSGYRRLGHLDLSSIYNTKEEYSLPYSPYSVYDFNANDDYVFAIRSDPLSLDVRVADITNPELVASYLPGDFGFGPNSLWQAVAVGNYLYLGASYLSNELKVYDFSNPQSPQFVSSVAIPQSQGIRVLSAYPHRK